MQARSKHRRETDGELTVRELTLVAKDIHERRYLADIEFMHEEGHLTPLIDMLEVLIDNNQLVRTPSGWKYNPTLPQTDKTNERQKQDRHTDIMFG